MPDLGNWGQHGALRSDVPYGQHIPLYCVNHPHLRWHTKNIAPIGARSIFFNLGGDLTERECACSGADLRVLPPDGQIST